MASPYKMKGHTLPGIKQKKASPMKEPITIAALIGAGASLASAGAGQISASKKRKADKEAQAAEAAGGANVGTGKIGTSTKLV
jgi:hypothetical protein